MIRKMMSPQYSYLKRLQRAVYNVILEHEKGRMFDFSVVTKVYGFAAGVQLVRVDLANV
jgi:hypothetical protein